jgi:DNA-directed RNA polymerase subunit F
MKSEIEIIAETLNETIEKGEKIEKSQKERAKKYREELRKGLTHNPFDPKFIGPAESLGVYTPYKWTTDGFMPYGPDHWREQGDFRMHTIQEGDYVRTMKVHRGSYLNTEQFYNRYVRPEKKVQAFRGFGKSVMDTIDIVKAEVGTKHKYKDGRTYLKTDKGWRPVGEAMGDRIRRKDESAHQELDKHYRSTSTIKNIMSRKAESQNLRKELKDNYRNKLAGLLDGPMPKEYEEIFNEDDE